MRARWFLTITLAVVVLLAASCPLPVSAPVGGSLIVSVTDDADARALPSTVSVTAARYTVSGEGPGTARFSQSTSSATVTISALALGSWTVTVDAFDMGGTLIGEWIGNVTITTGQTAITLTWADPPGMAHRPGGGLLVSITARMADPIPLKLSGVPAQMARGGTMTATATVQDGTKRVRYVWSLDGVVQRAQTGARWTFGSDLATGYYRLDVGASTLDGERAGSATRDFEVTRARK